MRTTSKMSQLDDFQVTLSSGLTENIKINKMYLAQSANLLHRLGTHVKFSELVKRSNSRCRNANIREAAKEFLPLQLKPALTLMTIVTITAGERVGATPTIALARRHPAHSNLANGQTRVGTATHTHAINTWKTLTPATVRQPQVRGILVVCQVNDAVVNLEMHVKFVNNKRHVQLVNLVIKLTSQVHVVLMTIGNMTHSEFG